MSAATRRRLVAGVDSSTQSVKVVVCDVDTGEVVRSGRAAHPDGTEVSAAAWLDAYREATADPALLDGVEAISVGGQQHGMVTLDADGELVRDALLWNDNRSAGDARDLIAELGGRAGLGRRRRLRSRWRPSLRPRSGGWPGTSRRTPPASSGWCCRTTT